MELLIAFLVANDILLSKLAVSGLILFSLWGLIDGYRRGWGFEDTTTEMLGRGFMYPCLFGFGVALTAGIIYGLAWVVG